MIPSPIPEAFRAARIEAGITQVAVARAIRVTPAAVCRFERQGDSLGRDRVRFAVKWLAWKMAKK